MTANDARRAHELLDELDARAELSQEQEKLLRSFLPEMPKQKTLEEIHEEVYEKWLNVEGDLWDSDNWGTMEEFLGGLQYQLKDLIDAPANTPALPAGMRLADHEKLGRVIVSPKSQNGNYMIFAAATVDKTGADWFFATDGQLTFLEADSDAEPTHPEFLETEADYRNAPEDTIVASAGNLPCHKFYDKWSSFDFREMKDDRGMSRARRRVLRWGWGE